MHVWIKCQEVLAELGDIFGFMGLFAAFEINEDNSFSVNDDVFDRVVHLVFGNIKLVHGVALVQDVKCNVLSF